MEKNSRLLTLDAMRGIAAIFVVLFHFHDAGILIAPSGYLAVDFFFLLSGFVIAKTYDVRLAAGLGFFQFAAMRAIRLYPLFIVGVIIGILRFGGQIVLDRPGQMTVTEVTGSVLFEMFLLPSPMTEHLFNMNGPGWSLFFELAINLVYASILVKANLRTLSIIAAVCGACLIWIAVAYGSLGVGYDWRHFHGGVARVGFSFTVGIIIARTLRARPRNSKLAMIPMLAVMGLMAVSVDGSARIAYDLFVAMVAAPVLVWLGATYNPQPSQHSVSRTLGELSYPIYAVHYPAMWMFGYVAHRAGVPNYVWIPVFIILLLFGAQALNKYWDQPVRRKLSEWLRRARIPRGATQAPS